MLQNDQSVNMAVWGMVGWKPCCHSNGINKQSNIDVYLKHKLGIPRFVGYILCGRIESQCMTKNIGWHERGPAYWNGIGNIIMVSNRNVLKASLESQSYIVSIRGELLSFKTEKCFLLKQKWPMEWDFSLLKTWMCEYGGLDELTLFLYVEVC